MRGLSVFFSLLLLALPSFAQSAVDNCCQVNRSCATDDEWVQSWFDYQAGQCPASAPVSTSPPASSPPATGVDNCCQVNRSCTADPEWIQGWHDYQAGLCPVSAPAGASQPAAPAPAPAADVDNCCQVNRSCAADADWIQGWHDFQAGLCPVSAPVSTSQPAAPAPAPAADVDNCCQVGRACATDADWIQGYNDYQAGQCGGGSGPAPMSSVSSANHYSFSGTGRAATRAFTLTRGKWRFNPNLGGRNAITYLVQVSSPGQRSFSGTCLTFPANLHWRGESGSGLQLEPYSHEFAVRYPCDVQFVVFGDQSANEVQGQAWSISINKTDGNI